MLIMNSSSSLFCRGLRFLERLSCRAVLKLFLRDRISIGKGVAVSHGATFHILGSLTIGDHCRIEDGCFLESRGKNGISIGNRVYINRNVSIYAHKSVRIGDDCMFGPNVSIYDHDHAVSDGVICKTEFICDSVVIEDGCWIGAGSIILQGSVIEKNCILGANTVIKGHIPANSTVIDKREKRITRHE